MVGPRWKPEGERACLCLLSVGIIGIHYQAWVSTTFIYILHAYVFMYVYEI
jgi:hypothetical protein